MLFEIGQYRLDIDVPKRDNSMRLLMWSANLVRVMVA